ncbi:MHC class I polypeptide-related sequence B-like isoform X1 [Cervus canadensis]|uniref:MHC class I polypeptide-related sequence B-like isoform X1 n=1 Tax=Cervus canadensis TaxID=1574408 RepID=UPI001CA37167|nr:MHC class I polypeptide-related sequence B-like isoform X1 [Cervus canadensis]
MGLSLVWPFLAGAAFFVLLRTAAGSHRLSYNTTVLSWDGFVQARFFAEGYLDGQAFLHFDDTKWRAEPQGQWAERLGAEMWETESKDLNEAWKELRKLLAEILSLQEEKRGLHSLQETMGCEIREDSHPRGFRLLHFDGELLLSCYPEAHGCARPQSSARTLAMEMEKSWDTDGFLSKHFRAHVQGELCGRLRGYLESWTGFMERTVPPAVNVTRSQDSEGMVHLTCRAFGFFPRNISVAWFRDEEPMSWDTQESGGVLPDGNGTYYTWETIIIPQGEEQRVKCLVGHSGNHSTHLAPLGKTLVHQRSLWIIVITVVAALALIGFCVCVYKYINRMTASATGRPEPISLQDLDQFRTEPTDHNGLTHPEFQSLCQTLDPSVQLGKLRTCSQKA